MKNRKLWHRLSGAALIAALPVVSFAQTAAVDVTDIETSFSNQVTPMTAVLVASLGLAILVAVFSWIRRVAK
jgi:hypothetical protein